MAFRKIEAGLVHADVDEFIGKTGTIFYDNSLGDFRISDGVTPGGIALSFGGGGGGNYTLPTATTTVKGGVKIDGSTITINNQVISVGTVPYSNLSGAPTIPSNTNQLTNGAGYITSSALSTYALSSSVPTNNNQLTNGSGYITSAALSGYATESYVTTRGYLTAVSWNDVSGKPTFATVATSGSYADLTNKPSLFSGSYTDLTNKPTIPTDINQLTDASGLLGQGGGSGGTTYITNTVENPYSFSIAGDDSTLREILNGESIKISGSSGITVTTDTEGNVTITGPSLVGYATETYVTTRGYLTTVSYADVTDKPALFSGSYTDLTNKPTIPSNTNELTNGAGYITNSALTGLATESFVTSLGYITGLSWSELTDKPNLAGTYSWSVAADDSTLREISSGESIKFIGASNISTASDAEGNITITGPDLSSYATQSYVTSQNYITSTALTGLATENYVNTRGFLTTVSYNDLTDKPNLAGTYSWSIAADDSTQIEISAGNLVKIVGSQGVTTTSTADGQITITGPDLSAYALSTAIPTNTSDLNNDSGYITSALNANGTLSLPILSAAPANLQAGQIALANGTSWDPLGKAEGRLYTALYTGTGWIEIGGITSTSVYAQILELG